MSEHVYTDNSACKICMNCKHGHEKRFNVGNIFIDGFYCEHKKQWIEMFMKACKDFEPKGGNHE